MGIAFENFNNDDIRFWVRDRPLHELARMLYKMVDWFQYSLVGKHIRYIMGKFFDYTIVVHSFFVRKICWDRWYNPDPRRDTKNVTRKKQLKVQLQKSISKMAPLKDRENFYGQRHIRSRQGLDWTLKRHRRNSQRPQLNVAKLQIYKRNSQRCQLNVDISFWWHGLRYSGVSMCKKYDV